MMKKEILFSVLIFSIFLLSSCDIYDTLYIKQTGAEDVSDDEIVVDFAEEEYVEKIIPEDATVLIVEETELVSLVPNAEDPDNDALIFTFTSPLDNNGEWQTKYGDAGEYTVTVTASDGSLTANKEVLVIVNRKEEAPTFKSSTPIETALTIDETNSIAFSVETFDFNDDVLRYSWKLDGVEIGNKDSIDYKTTFEDSGSHTMKISVSDGLFDTEKIWSVTVNNVNRKPQIADIGDIDAKETDTVVVNVEAWDDDGDDLSYSTSDQRFVQDGSAFIWESNYDDAGKHEVTFSVSDGEDTSTQVVKITIENVNRAPVILEIGQK
jgi:hypothetical protein